MNTNSCFFIGKDHRICEDYATDGINNGIPYAIVSDGCSASSFVDIGARLIALAAIDNIINSALNLGNNTINRAYNSIKEFRSLNQYCLDATLLCAWIKNNELNCHLYGDGVLVRRTKDGINTVHISLTSGAPDYLSYDLDPARRKSYEKIEDNKKVIAICIGGKTIQVDVEPLKPYILNTPVEDGDVVTIISDGINSFRKADNTPIPWADLVEEFTGYKTIEGEFVLRRIAAFKRKCLKEGTTHSDDISIASIVV